MTKICSHQFTRLTSERIWESLSLSELHSLVRETFDYWPDAGVLTWAVGYFHPRYRQVGSRVGNYKLGSHSNICFLGKSVGVYKLIYFHQTGEWPPVVDHINGVKSDDRIHNLRAADKSKNSFNRKRKPPVYKEGKRWVARPVVKHGKSYRPGRFNTRQEALAAYESKALELYGDFYERGVNKL